MDLININDNKCFWKTVKPFLSNKGSHTSKINLENNDEVISDDLAVKSLGICEEVNFNTDVESSDPVDLSLLKYKYHPSVLKIKELVGDNISEFNFSEITLESIEKEIKKLNVSKKGTFKNISPKLLLDTLMYLVQCS